MTNRDDKKKQEELRRQQEQDRARQDRFFSLAEQKNPLQEAQEREALDWMQGTQSPTFDATKLKGMSPYLSLYRNAVAEREGERMGGGALALGQSNPQHAALLKELQGARRQEQAAGALERAFQLKDATIRGTAGDLMSLEQQRRLQMLAEAGGQSRASTQGYVQYQPRRSFWADLALGGLGAGASILGPGFGEGGRWSR